MLCFHLNKLFPYILLYFFKLLIHNAIKWKLIALKSWWAKNLTFMVPFRIEVSKIETILKCIMYCENEDMDYNAFK